MTAATIRNAISALRKRPYLISPAPILRVSPEKSGWPPIAAISGVRTSLTNEFTMAVKAAPITTAMASSTTLPRIRNFLNPLNMATPRSVLPVTVRASAGAFDATGILLP